MTLCLTNAKLKENTVSPLLSYYNKNKHSFLIHNTQNRATLILYQKKRVKLFIAFGIAVVLLLVAILAINAVKEQKAYNALLAEIDSYVDQERYEEAFDKINTLDISYDDKTIYREMLIPYMQKNTKKLAIV